MFTQNTIKRLKNPLIIISSHDFNSIDHITELYKDEFRVLMESMGIQEAMSESKQRLRHCVDQNYREERTSND